MCLSAQRLKKIGMPLDAFRKSVDRSASGESRSELVHPSPSHPRSPMPQAPAQYRRPGQVAYVVRERVRKQSIDADRGTAAQRGYDQKLRRYREGFPRSLPLCRPCERRLGNSHAGMMKATCPLILSWIPIAPPGFAFIVPNINEDLGVIDIRNMVW